MDMIACPRCRKPLVRQKTSLGVRYVCQACSGQSVSLAVLRRDCHESFLRRLWLQAKADTARGGRACPHCAKRMALVQYPGPTGQAPLMLEVCPLCQGVWFDAQEREHLPTKPPSQPAGQMDPSLSPKAREAVALYELSRRQEQETDDGGPEHYWQYLPAIFGLPVETEVPLAAERPWVTWALSAVLVIVTVGLLLWGGGDGLAGMFQEADSATQPQPTDALTKAIYQWGFVPKKFWRYGGLSFLSSFFLHANLFHLLVNVYFLMVFGDNVETHLGKSRYLLLLAAATIVGNLCHAALDPRSGIPAAGASGGICGVIAYYALAFPHAQLGFMWWRWGLRWFHLSAIWWLAMYVLLQVLGAWDQIKGTSDVSSLAHLGGLGVGVAAGLWAMRRRLIPIELADA